jgi:hypothetical protein
VVGWGNDDSDALSVAKNCWERYRALIPVKKIRKPNHVTSLQKNKADYCIIRFSVHLNVHFQILHWTTDIGGQSYNHYLFGDLYQFLAKNVGYLKNNVPINFSALLAEF